MTTLSIETELERIYEEPVTVHGYRIITTDPTITLEVELTIEGENVSRTYVEITK